MFSIFDVKAKENKIPLYINKQLTDTNSTIYTDESKIKKIVSNLLENALKFTNKGFIEIGSRMFEDQTDEKFIEIYVKDTGIGIKSEHQKIIFNRFAQADKKLRSNIGGLGLGLAIAKENAELLGGKIFLESEIGKGSVFYIRIPYKPVHTDNISEENTSSNAPFFENDKKYKILIAEDEEINYFFLETLINDVIELKCDIFHAKNGKEAVDLCHKIENLGLILMDIKMPVMNGIDALKIIRKSKPYLPIVAQTAYSSADDKDNAMRIGFSDFISKPIDEDLLMMVFNKFLIIKE